MRLALSLFVMLATLAAPALAGPELPMYQLPQANQVPMLPPPATKPGARMETSCTPEQAPQDGTTQVAAASVTPDPQKYHLVNGKCVPEGN